MKKKRRLKSEGPAYVVVYEDLHPHEKEEINGFLKNRETVWYKTIGRTPKQARANDRRHGALSTSESCQTWFIIDGNLMWPIGEATVEGEEK